MGPWEAAGMDMILSKPCSIPKLRALISTILLAREARVRPFVPTHQYHTRIRFESS